MRAIIGAALLLAGCTLGPRYESPSVDIPPAFRATADTAAAAWPAEEWWRNFQAPELDGLIAQARAYNNDLGAAAARVLQADAQARISGAPLLPSKRISSRQRRAPPQYAGSVPLPMSPPG